MTRHNDPRMGESSYRLTNIVRAEPDGSLFMVPADYTVKETGIRKHEPSRNDSDARVAARCAKSAQSHGKLGGSHGAAQD